MSLKKIISVGLTGATLTITAVLGVGCSDNKLENYTNYVDLNGDNVQEIITGGYTRPDWNSVTYDIYARFSNNNGTYGNPRLIFRSYNPGNRLDDIRFTDLDGDGDQDIVFNKYVYPDSRTTAYDTYINRNDGKGNFSKTELINRKIVNRCSFP